MPEFECQHFSNEILSQCLGIEISVVHSQKLTGGCIHEAFKLSCEAGTFFLKYNQPEFQTQFEKEAKALNLLRETGPLKVPEVFQIGIHRNRAYLLMEYIDPVAAGHDFWQKFGENLAHLHHQTSEDGRYGLSFDNYIGELPQKNGPNKSWIDFFIENRLEAQINLANANNRISPEFVKRFHKLYHYLEKLLVEEPPSLLHGDLWRGNFLCDADGQAVLIDPAIYYGNREIELAFTQLFGGFSPSFYESYEQIWPLQPGFGERKDLYNLYPLLVHVNLFGRSYLSGIEKVIKRFT